MKVILVCFLVIATATVYVQADYKRVCYFTNWAQWRDSWGKYTVDDIDASLCSHLIYAFVQLDNTTGPWNLATIETNDVENYKKFQAYKISHPGLKTLVAVGGYNHGTERFTALSSSPKSGRQEFIKQAISFLREHEFDGLDLDWEFPGHLKSPPADKQRFTVLVQELSQAFNEEAKTSDQDRLLLTAAVSVGKDVIEGGLEIAQLSQFLDWFNLMAYDYNGRWNKKTGANAPLLPRRGMTEDEATLNIDWTVDHYITHGAPALKLVLGIGAYGQSFALIEKKQTAVGSATNGEGGGAGKYVKQRGFLSYYEICEVLRGDINNEIWIRKWDTQQNVPYAYNANTGNWVGYDDVESVTIKVEFIKNRGLGGAMIWALDFDDFTGRRCNMGKYPLLTTINKVLNGTNNPASTPPLTSTEDNGSYMRVCYFTNWSRYRKTGGTFTVRNIDPALCTHLIFAFANIKNGTGYIISIEEGDDQYMWPGSTELNVFDAFNALKQKNPKLKTLLAIGGWTAGTDPFTYMTASDENRKIFVKNAIGFLRVRGFDGLDLDWEFPAARGSPAADKQRFTLLTKDLREAFELEAIETGKPRLLLSAAVHIGKGNIDNGYEIPEISKYLDWFNLMAYDFHGRWGKIAGANAPLYGQNDNDVLSVDWAVKYWIQHGAPSRKIVLGMGTYGQTYTLNGNNNNPGAPTTGSGGSQGQYTGTAGFLGYYEICGIMKNNDWNCTWEDKQQFPYCYNQTEWVGYDDLRSIEMKVHYVMNNSLGGAMVWPLDTDDFTGNFCNQGKYPIVSLIKGMLSDDDELTTTFTPTNYRKNNRNNSGNPLQYSANLCLLIFNIVWVIIRNAE